MGESYNNIKRLCDLKGISIYKMCSDIGMSRGIMTELKSGRTKQLGAKNLSRVAEYLGVSVDEILGVKTESPLHMSSELSEEERYMITMFRNSPQEKRQRALAYLENPTANGENVLSPEE